jgi:hypothetical protein
MTLFGPKVNRQDRVDQHGRGVRRLGARVIAWGLPLAILATGCGATPPLQIASVGTPNPATATPGDRRSCWADDQRIEGVDSMPQQYTEQPAMRRTATSTTRRSIASSRDSLFRAGIRPALVQADPDTSSLTSR